MRKHLSTPIFNIGVRMCERNYPKPLWMPFIQLSHWVQGEGEGPWIRSWRSAR
jgi:hypothetical protein